jgi:bisphosphoglycerate-independent phosphoglycerate mutase (AlkP superfamily)
MAKKAKDSEINSYNRDKAFKRKHKAVFLLNDKEQEAFEVYCKRYKVKNKARFMRESVMRVVMDQFMDDYPTLFEKKDLDRLRVKDRGSDE